MDVLDGIPTGLRGREIAIKASADLPKPILAGAIGPLVETKLLKFRVMPEDLLGGRAFEGFQNLGNRILFEDRVDDQMDVFWHDYISPELEPKKLPGCIKSLQEEFGNSRMKQAWSPLVC